ncbi:hypothetical protein MTR67_027007 [Solanum verrucosum]|uniref:Uncharacterized protein n=1 Tax=Solanum verrucosum TaxID=315347 RepID=A0AAF0TUH3_SOLVR|nr:hypothetical protein MTR67_027007 [Solanum verrucosum]
MCFTFLSVCGKYYSTNPLFKIIIIIYQIIILCKIILIPKMSSNRNHKNVHAFQKSNADRNARRCELYRLMPPEEKEILLARRRAKRAEMRKHNLSESSMNNDLATTSSSNSTIVFVAQSSDLMREPMLLLSEIGSTMPLEINYIKFLLYRNMKRRTTKGILVHTNKNIPHSSRSNHFCTFFHRQIQEQLKISIFLLPNLISWHLQVQFYNIFRIRVSYSLIFCFFCQTKHRTPSILLKTFKKEQ